jgi:tetraacyldisaccharide 4'-kinase
MWLLKKLLFPVSLLYALVVYVRNFLYDMGIFKSVSYKTPIICVGNLSMGGTGKTPMTELLILLLQNRYEIAILSRGYKRESSGFVLATTESTVGQLGDEPFQIHSKFSKINVAVDADRRNGISILERDCRPDVILLDDAFQHRRVKPGFSILLTAYGKLYSDDWYLPTGTLRDSRREARRADLIVVTKCPPHLTEAERARIKNSLNPKKNQSVLFSCLSYTHEVKGSVLNRRLDDFKGKKITLVTGIADPEPLISFLTERGIFFEHLTFSDHHSFTANEVSMLNGKENILTTEKDYMRLKNRVENCYYIPVSHKFLSNDDALLEESLFAFMKRHS